MRRHRGHWNRGKWGRKTSPRHDASSYMRLQRSPPMGNVVKDESDTWPDRACAQVSRSGWDADCAQDNRSGWDKTIVDDDKKIFQWDDSGALEHLKKAEANLQHRIRLSHTDYLNASNQYAPWIDWETRWVCTLPDCAENFEKYFPKGSSTRRHQSDSSNAVIFGLPELKDDTGCSGTPSLHLPVDFMPVPTGWGEAEDSPRNAEGLESSMPPVKARWLPERQVESTSQGRGDSGANGNDACATGLERPENRRSYQHIVPSGWEDVQAYPPVVRSGWEDVQGDPPIVPSGWGSDDSDPRLDTQMHQADSGWCDHPCPSSNPAWANPPVIQPPPVIGKYKHEKSRKHGYWRQKRGSETKNLESSGRRNMQRPENSMSTMRMFNYDPRSPRMNRVEPFHAQ